MSNHDDINDRLAELTEAAEKIATTLNAISKDLHENTSQLILANLRFEVVFELLTDILKNKDYYAGKIAEHLNKTTNR